MRHSLQVRMFRNLRTKLSRKDDHSEADHRSVVKNLRKCLDRWIFFDSWTLNGSHPDRILSSSNSIIFLYWKRITWSESIPFIVQRIIGRLDRIRDNANHRHVARLSRLSNKIRDKPPCRRVLLHKALTQGDQEIQWWNQTQVEYCSNIDWKYSDRCLGYKYPTKLFSAYISIQDSFTDEPTTGIDPAARKQLWNVINQARESRKTILLTSQMMEECETLCTNLSVLVKGNLKCIGTKEHLRKKYLNGFILELKLKPMMPRNSNERVHKAKDYFNILFHDAQLK